MARLQSKTWNLRDPRDSKEAANVGRELGKWATSSTAAVVPIKFIQLALVMLHNIMEVLTANLQYQVAKSMTQDIVWALTDQINPTLKEICIDILLEYARICSSLSEIQEMVDCCERGISLTEGRQEDLAKFHFHLYLGHAYIDLLDAPQAEKELCDARNSMPHNFMAHDSEVFAKTRAEAFIEGRSFYNHLLVNFKGDFATTDAE